MNKPQDKFTYYCSRKRCGAVICSADKPVVLFAKFKCPACNQVVTFRPSAPQQSPASLTAAA